MLTWGNYPLADWIRQVYYCHCQLLFASCFRQWQVSGPAAAANDNLLPLGFCGNARFMKATKGAIASKLRESSGSNRGVVRSLTSSIDTRYHCLWRKSLAEGWLGQKPCGVRLSVSPCSSPATRTSLGSASISRSSQ